MHQHHLPTRPGISGKALTIIVIVALALTVPWWIGVLYIAGIL